MVGRFGEVDWLFFLLHGMYNNDIPQILTA